MSAKRFAGLDHLRALALVLVFLYHYSFLGGPTWMDPLSSFGWSGVDLFFVLSGYLIGGQLLGSLAKDRPISYSEFYFKRLLRILPAYLAVLALYFIIPAFKERSELPPLWRFLSFTQNFGLDLSTHGAFSHAWSLCIEEQFYLLLPLIVMVLSARKAGKNAIGLIVALFAFGFIIRIFNWHHFITPILKTEDHKGFGPAYYKWIYYPTYNRLDGLLAGVCLAGLFHFHAGFWRRITRHGNGLLALGIGLITGAYFLCKDLYTFQAAVFGYPLVSIAYGVIVLAALSPSCILYRVHTRVTSLIATLSYSLYLTHKQLIHLAHLLLAKLGMENNTYLLFWLSVLLAFAAGLLLHLSVEQPFLRLRDRILAKKTGLNQPAVKA